MIELTRFNGEHFVLNADLIEMIEATPDTVIRLTSGKKLLVKETVAEVVERVIAYARLTHFIAIPLDDEEDEADDVVTAAEGEAG